MAQHQAERILSWAVFIGLIESQSQIHGLNQSCRVTFGPMPRISQTTTILCALPMIIATKPFAALTRCMTSFWLSIGIIPLQRQARALPFSCINGENHFTRPRVASPFAAIIFAGLPATSLSGPSLSYRRGTDQNASVLNSCEQDRRR